MGALGGAWHTHACARTLRSSRTTHCCARTHPGHGHHPGFTIAAAAATAAATATTATALPLVAELPPLSLRRTIDSHLVAPLRFGDVRSAALAEVEGVEFERVGRLDGAVVDDGPVASRAGSLSRAAVADPAGFVARVRLAARDLGHVCAGERLSAEEHRHLGSGCPGGSPAGGPPTPRPNCGGGRRALLEAARLIDEVRLECRRVDVRLPTVRQLHGLQPCRGRGGDECDDSVEQTLVLRAVQRHAAAVVVQRVRRWIPAKLPLRDPVAPTVRFAAGAQLNRTAGSGAQLDEVAVVVGELHGHGVDQAGG